MKQNEADFYAMACKIIFFCGIEGHRERQQHTYTMGSNHFWNHFWNRIWIFVFLTYFRDLLRIYLPSKKIENTKANKAWNKVAYEFKNATLKLLWPHCSVEGFRVVEMWHTIRAVTRALLRISLMTSMFRLNLIKYAGDKQHYLVHTYLRFMQSVTLILA